MACTEEDVRRLALALHDVTEKPSYGTPGFRVHDRLFARLHDRPGLLVLWRASTEEKEALIAADPATFTTTPHYDGGPIVLVRLEAVGADELAELLAESWEVRAPSSVRAKGAQ